MALCRRTSTHSSTTKQLASVVPSLTELSQPEFCNHQLINFIQLLFRADSFSNPATTPSLERCKQFYSATDFNNINFKFIANNFNYSKNLNAVLGQLLKPLGYRKNGTRFTLSQGLFDFSFNLTRSSWNSLTNRPKYLSVYLEVVSLDRSIGCSIPLFRLTKEPFPVFYGPFFLDKLSWPEKCSLMASFTEKQLSEIDNYLQSIKWSYNSEESLINLLNEVKDQLINVGLPTVDYFRDFEEADLMTVYLDQQIRDKISQFYLLQLDNSSRFPLD